MTVWNIIVCSFEGSRVSASGVRHRILGAIRPPHEMTITIADAEDLEVDELRDVHAVVLVLDGDQEPARVLPQLAVLDDADVASLVLVEDLPPDGDPYPFASAVVEHLGADDAVVFATLAGLLNRQREVIRLRKEVAIAYRFHGGLKGEIARIHEELQLAAMVQREFLPRELPKLYGTEFAALWRPAHYVSGDIYDVARLDDDHIGVFLADAVGHGVPAALMTMVICRSLTTKIINGSTYRIIEPSEVLARLNADMIRRQGRSTRFATAVYAVVNCRTRMMRLAGAGHPPPLHLEADGSVHELTTPGGLLGVFADETYDQIEVELGVGDRIVLHSDGFEQAFPQDEADEYERRLPTNRYREVFLHHARAETPQAMVEALAVQVDDQLGSLHQVDDLTLICLHAGALEVAESAAPVRAAA